MLFFNGRQSYSTSDDGTAVDSCWLNLVLLQLAGRFYDAQLVSMKVKLMQFLPYYLEYILCMYSVHCSIVKMNQKLRSNKKLPTLISIMPITSILGKKKIFLSNTGS